MTPSRTLSLLVGAAAVVIVVAGISRRDIVAPRDAGPGADDRVPPAPRAARAADARVGRVRGRAGRRLRASCSC